MKLALNREYALRHLGVTVLMAGLCCWFGYDGFVAYPQTPAAELYRNIEGADAPAGFDLEKFKDQKTKTQYGFTVLAFFAALIVGSNLYKSWKFDVSFDDEGFTCAGRRVRYTDVKKVDLAQWEKKGIVRVDGITFDAWHHLGVKDFKVELEKARA